MRDALGDVPLVVSWGMTEGASQITATPFDAPARPGSVGVPVGCEVQVRRADGTPAGPDAVEVRVRGAGPHFRNCQVSVSAVGGGQQYTASCASETPLKAGGFERYDY